MRYLKSKAQVLTTRAILEHIKENQVKVEKVVFIAGRHIIVTDAIEIHVFTKKVVIWRHPQFFGHTSIPTADPELLPKILELCQRRETLSPQ